MNELKRVLSGNDAGGHTVTDKLKVIGSKLTKGSDVTEKNCLPMTANQPFITLNL